MNKIYLDACIYIYHLEYHAEFGARASRLFEKAEHRGLSIVASPLILHEIMAGVYGNPQIDTDEIYGLLVTHPGIEWVDYSIEIADLSANLRSRARLRTPDAIHVATAVTMKCENFITNDHRLEKVKLPGGMIVSLI